MNIHSLIPLIATIAYIPLIIILYANRPWQRQKQVFVLFLFAAMLWSLSDFLFRSDFLVNEKTVIAIAILCSVVFAATQLHYFLRTYYETKKPGVPVAYIIMVLAFIWVIVFTPQRVVVDKGVPPVYGTWIYPLLVYYIVLIGRDVFILVKKLRSIVDPVARNQLAYLLVSIFIPALIVAFSTGSMAQEYPLAHVANFITALLLTYTVIKHQLLDLRIVLRRSLAITTMSAIGIGIYLLLYVIGHFLFHFDVISINFLLGMGSALLIAFVIYQVRYMAIGQIDKLFYRDTYEYRQKLKDFTENRIRGMLNLDEMGNELLNLLCGAIRCKQASLLLPREDNGEFFVRFSIGGTQAGSPLSIKNDSPIIQWLQKTKTYLPRDRLDISPEFKSLWKEELESIAQLNIQMFLPVISRNNIIGLLALGEKQHKHGYSLEDINYTEKILDNTATSIEKEYLQDRLRKREQALSLINQLAGVISSSLDIKEVYDAFVGELKEFIEVDYAAIALVEGDNIYFAAVSTQVGSAWHTGEKIPMRGTGTEWVYLNRRPFYERDLTKRKRFWTCEEYIKRGLRSVLYLPLVNKGEVIGVLIIGSKNAAAYNTEQSILLEHLASQIAAPIENSRLFTKSEEIARVDGLTELFNRRHFDERMREEIARHSRYGDTLSMLLIDMDNFKKYNDTFGHLAGDRMLVHAAGLVKAATRTSDLVFRYGGDEFAVILPNSSTMDSFKVAERMRENFAVEMSGRQVDITISIGVASWPGDGTTLDEVCYAADMALYYAKRTGQNRTSIASRTLFSLNDPNVNVNTEAEVLSTIYALAATLEARDKYTYGHSRRVSRYAVSLAEALNLPPEQVALVSAAALLHDIGKVGIPDNVLNKCEKLFDEEWELLKQHPRLSATIVGHVPSLSACLAAVKHHHERWDGTGYPAGLKDEAIPVEARILTVTDSFEAMISERPYRKALSFKQAIAELEKCSGSQFDPAVVRAFIPIALSSAPDDIELEMQRSQQDQG
ncbi:MAG: diguanylate cyclase [Chloroflexi bacterium]|nr:diguanylate cyclase [Chloroflexota bacterium]